MPNVHEIAPLVTFGKEIIPAVAELLHQGFVINSVFKNIYPNIAYLIPVLSTSDLMSGFFAYPCGHRHAFVGAEGLEPPTSCV